MADMPALAAGNVFRWLEARLSIDSLLDEGDDSISRIEEVVKAVRSYSRPEHGKLEEIDLHEGIEKAITMLSHRPKGVTLFREFDPRLPRIPAYASELNQVWTHLIDNALTRSPARAGCGSARGRKATLSPSKSQTTAQAFLPKIRRLY